MTKYFKKFITIIFIMITSFASNAEILPVLSSSYLGDASDEEGVFGVGIKSNGDIVISAEIGANTEILKDATKLFTTENEMNKVGIVIILAPDGKTIKQKSIISYEIRDLAIDSKDNIYVACGINGIICLSPDAKGIYWYDLDRTYTHRVDVGSDGTVAVLADLNKEKANSSSGPGVIHLFKSNGKKINSFPGVGLDGKDRNVLDLCVHSKSNSVIVTGWRQATDWSEKANHGGPVQIAFVRSLGYDGKIKWNAYDWSTDGQSEKYLNKPENNMADTRGLRCSIGPDDKLYVVFMAAGGNHIFRYSPFDINKKVEIPKGDTFNDFSGSKSEHKTFFGRYNPENGEYEIGQQLTARISPIKANALWCNEGEIIADKYGRIYLAGYSAYGLPIFPHKMLAKKDAKNTFNPFGAGSYLGGPFLIISSPDFVKREYVTRITPYGGFSRAIATKILSDETHIVVLGGTVNLKGPAYVKNAIQPIPGFGQKDAFFTIFSSTAPADEELKNSAQFDVSCELSKKVNIRNSDPQVVELAPLKDASKRVAFKYYWSEEIPLTPSDKNIYNGTPIYGGLYMEILNLSEKRKKLDKTEINSPFSIQFSAKAKENEKLLTRAAILLKPSDFSDYKENDKFSFDINSSIEVKLACSAFYTYPWKTEEGNPTWKVHYWSNTEFRWLVKNSGKFYLSKKVEKWKSHQDNYFTLYFTNDNDDGEWAEWTPSDELTFNSDTANFQEMNFENIEAIGIWLSDLEFRPTLDSNNAGINKPSAAISGIFLKSISANLARNKESIKRPIAKFTASTTKPYINEEITFDASNSEPGDGIINFYSWLFPGGYTTSGNLVKYNFKYLGPHNVNLTVWNDKFQPSLQQVMRIEVFPDNVNENSKNQVVCAFGGLAEKKDKFEIIRNESVTTTEIKDFDGDKVPDKKIELPFDEDEPFSTLPGTKIYAGWSVESKMPGGEKGETHINNELTIEPSKNNPSLLTLGYRTRREIPGKVDFIAIILKEDFMNNWNKSKNQLKLVKGSELIAGPFEEIPENGKMHFVIKDKDGYWVSDKFLSRPQNFKAGTQLQYLPKFVLKIGFGGKDEPKWTKIDPFKGFQLPQRPTFILRQFNDILGFGILWNTEKHANNGWLKLYGFSLLLPPEGKK